MYGYDSRGLVIILRLRDALKVAGIRVFCMFCVVVRGGGRWGLCGIGAFFL